MLQSTYTKLLILVTVSLFMTACKPEIDGNDTNTTDSNETAVTTGKVKKTGQTKSYDENGTEVDGTLKDDGFYQMGLNTDYIRDDAIEIVTDNLTNLMWQDGGTMPVKPWLTDTNYDSCIDGNDTACFDTSGDTAVTYCEDLDFGGYTDWRLPTIVELQGLNIDSDQYISAVDAVFERNNNNYWSSTNSLSDTAWAWITYYTNTFYKKKTDLYYVRCVREK